MAALSLRPISDEALSQYGVISGHKLRSPVCSADKQMGPVRSPSVAKALGFSAGVLPAGRMCASPLCGSLQAGESSQSERMNG